MNGYIWTGKHGETLYEPWNENDTREPLTFLERIENGEATANIRRVSSYASLERLQRGLLEALEEVQARIAEKDRSKITTCPHCGKSPGR